jgi:hypothetical protein
LGIKDGEEGDMAEVNEPLESGNRHLYALRKKIWIVILESMFSTDKMELVDKAINDANRIYDEHIDFGQAPEGHICRMEKRELLEWAKKSAEAAQEKLLIHFPNHKFIEKDEFTVNCDKFTINGHYTLTVIPKDPQDKSSNIGILSFDKNGKPSDNPNLWLEGFLWWIDEIREGNAHPITLITLHHGSSPGIELSSMNIDGDKLPDMEKWLTEILSQILIEKRSEYLPFKIIAEITKPERKKKGQEVKNFEERLHKLTFHELKNKLAESDYGKFLRALKLTDAKPTEMDDDELRQLVALRYSPMFETFEEGLNE